MTLTEVDIRRSIEALLTRHEYQLMIWNYTLRSAKDGSNRKVHIIQIEASKEEEVK